ncbi:MAG TPA: HD domain-containing protein [Gemmatimonadaceae bacterium]
MSAPPHIIQCPRWTHPHPEAPITTSAPAIPLLLAAAHFAAERHEQQRRKGGDQVPYINHPIRVAHLLAETGGITDPDVLAAALLHDTIEDTDTTAGELRARFGDRITALVLEMSDDKGLEKGERKARQVRDAPHKSAEARCIKLADKTANVHDIAFRPPANWSWERRAEYLDWAERVVGACGATNPALERLFGETLAAGRAQLASERAGAG